MTCWCKAAEFGESPCKLARRKDWGVCRSCWKHKIAGNTAKEKAYDEWWDTHKDALNHEDEKRERRVLGLEEPPVFAPRAGQQEEEEEEHGCLSHADRLHPEEHGHAL